MLKPHEAAWWAPLWKRIAVVALVSVLMVYEYVSGGYFVAMMSAVIVGYLVNALFTTYPKTPLA